MAYLVSVLAAVAAGTTAPPAAGLDDMVLDLESGPFAIIQNDQRYGAAGTPYNAGTVALNRSLFEARRIVAEARLGGRHTVLFTYAPFDVTTRVTLDAPLTFRDTTFPAGALVDHRYLFDGWRAGYLYDVVTAGPWSLAGGATLGVRNAVVALTQVDGTRFAAERDIGPVPALKLRAAYRPPAAPYALLDVDGGGTAGLSPVTGGILDAALTLGVPLWPGLDGTLRLRWLAGGAEVPSRAITNWAQFVGATAGFRFSFARFQAPTAPAP
jgi:hypothetical protein